MWWWCVQLDDTGKATVNIFSQQYEKQKRHRSGYDPSAGMEGGERQAGRQAQEEEGRRADYGLGVCVV